MVVFDATLVSVSLELGILNLLKDYFEDCLFMAAKDLKQGEAIKVGKDTVFVNFVNELVVADLCLNHHELSHVKYSKKLEHCRVVIDPLGFRQTSQS